MRWTRGRGACGPRGHPPADWPAGLSADRPGPRWPIIGRRPRAAESRGGELVATPRDGPHDPTEGYGDPHGVCPHEVAAPLMATAKRWAGLFRLSAAAAGALHPPPESRRFGGNGRAEVGDSPQARPSGRTLRTPSYRRRPARGREKDRILGTDPARRGRSVPLPRRSYSPPSPQRP